MMTIDRRRFDNRKMVTSNLVEDLTMISQDVVLMIEKMVNTNRRRFDDDRKPKRFSDDKPNRRYGK